MRPLLSCIVLRGSFAVPRTDGNAKLSERVSTATGRFGLEWQKPHSQEWLCQTTPERVVRILRPLLLRTVGRLLLGADARASCTLLRCNRPLVFGMRRRVRRRCLPAC